MPGPSSARDGAGPGLREHLSSSADALARSAGLAAEIDVVLGADCLYDPATAALLAKCCADLVAKTKGVVCIAEPEKERAIGCRAAFLDACTAAGATTRIVPLPKASSIHPPTVLVVASWE